MTGHFDLIASRMPKLAAGLDETTLDNPAVSGVLGALMQKSAEELDLLEIGLA